MNRLRMFFIHDYNLNIVQSQHRVQRMNSLAARKESLTANRDFRWRQLSRFQHGASGQSLTDFQHLENVQVLKPDQARRNASRVHWFVPDLCLGYKGQSRNLCRRDREYKSLFVRNQRELVQRESQLECINGFT